jgi:hypothetical protein
LQQNHRTRLAVHNRERTESKAASRWFVPAGLAADGLALGAFVGATPPALDGFLTDRFSQHDSSSHNSKKRLGTWGVFLNFFFVDVSQMLSHCLEIHIVFGE